MAVQALGLTLSTVCLDLLGSQKLWDLAIERFKHPPIEYLLSFEYDLDSMYYQIDQAACVTALHSFFHMFQNVFKRRTVAISRHDKSLDRIGSGSRELFVTIPLPELLSFSEFERLGNSVARVGRISYRQTCGIPMGGLPSAHLASIYLLMLEVQRKAMHLTKDFFFFRYLDNLPGVLDTRVTGLDTVKQTFLKIYGMPLKLEQSGCSIDTLEMRVSVIGDCFSYSSKPLLFDQVGNTIDGSIQRVPPPWCAKRPFFLGYYVPSAFLKCVRYSYNFLDFMISVENLIIGLMDFGFLIGNILAILKHFFQVKALCSNLFTYISYLLRLRLDLHPG